jgi:hypothetical protein
LEKHIRPYRNGRDIAQAPRNSMVIDLFGLPLDEVRSRFPEVYQWLFERVKPERDQNNRASRRENWWLFGETNPKLRAQLAGLSRFIATVETSKHRLFVFLDKEILPDNMLVNIASADAYHLGVLSSRIHVVWALAAGGDLGGNTPRYNKTRCFEPFPFPACDDLQTVLIRVRAESLGAHRKRQQALHTDLGLTDMYNVLEKLRTCVQMTEKERSIHDKGLVTLLKKHHDDLDSAVFAAYGWPENLTNEEILEKLVALNLERAKEEKQGVIRWLRPEYQNPDEAQVQVQVEMELEPEEVAAPIEKIPLPKDHTEQLQAVKAALSSLNGPAAAETVAKLFIKARSATVDKLLGDLVKLGMASKTDDGYCVL